MFRLLKPEEVQGKRILVRVDFNVPLKEDGKGQPKISDDSRILAHLETIKMYQDWAAAEIILLSHLETKKGPMSLKPVAIYLAKYWGWDRERIYPKQPAVDFQLSTNIFLLENTRFYSGEKTCDPNLAERFAQLGDLFVLDALSVAHRKHASVSGIPQFLPSFAGPLLAHEIIFLTSIAKNPLRPLVVIIGGAKIEDKMPVIEDFLLKADYVLCGGKVGKDMLKVGWPKPEYPQVLVPSDGPPQDIGFETVERFSAVIAKAGTIIWAGPMGMYEEPEFIAGTKAIAHAAIESPALKVVAGGNIQEALRNLGLEKVIGFISQGGGATLLFLAGKELPGLKALGYYLPHHLRCGIFCFSIHFPVKLKKF